MSPVIRPPDEDEDGIPFGREELMRALTTLEAVIADAPEGEGGPNWDKQGALRTIDRMREKPVR
ncbi:hypothetical protein ACWDV7_26770 [Streptomyces sp. NPDC003362]